MEMTLAKSGMNHLLCSDYFVSKRRFLFSTVTTFENFCWLGDDW